MSGLIILKRVIEAVSNLYISLVIQNLFTIEVLFYQMVMLEVLCPFNQLNS